MKRKEYLLWSFFWEKLTFSNIQFSNFKKFVARSVFGEPQLTQIPLNFKTSCCNLKIKGPGAKLCVAFYYFNFERNYDVRVHAFCWNREWKIQDTVLGRQTLCFSSYKNCILKVKLRWDGARERKKRAFFLPFILSEGNFFNICVLCQCKVYWIHFLNTHTFTYQKTLLHTLFRLFLNRRKPSVYP